MCLSPVFLWRVAKGDVQVELLSWFINVRRRLMSSAHTLSRTITISAHVVVLCRYLSSESEVIG
jgi:hypothetical protein